jgi:hypothetical protein
MELAPMDLRPVEHWLLDEMKWMIALAMPYYIHEDRWGVPCGPTLEMVQRDRSRETIYIDKPTTMTVAQYNAYLRQQETYHGL